MEVANASKYLGPAAAFRTSVFWRWNLYQDAVRQGVNIGPNAGAVAHGMDSIDLFLRGHVVGDYKLRPVNTRVQRMITLYNHIGWPVQQLYEDVFWLFVDAWKHLVKLELYECVPVLLAALKKVTSKFFAKVDRLVFPTDPEATEDDMRRTAYRSIIEKYLPQHPVTPIDAILKYHNRHAHVEEAERQGLNKSQMEVCVYMDDIANAFRSYLADQRANLRTFHAAVGELRQQYPQMPQPDLQTILSAIIGQDLRSTLVENEIWEIMPRFNAGWEKIKKRYRIQWHVSNLSKQWPDLNC